jgi:hypothetical protein
VHGDVVGPVPTPSSFSASPCTERATGTASQRGLSQARRGNIAGMKRSRRAGLRGAALAVVLAIGGASPAAPATATIK